MAVIINKSSLEQIFQNLTIGFIKSNFIFFFPTVIYITFEFILITTWECNVIHQKRHFFYRSIFKSFIGRSTRLLIDNSSESKKSYILLGLSVYRHCQRKMGKEELSMFLESSDHGEGFVFYSRQARPWCRWVLPSQTAWWNRKIVSSASVSVCHLGTTTSAIFS